MASSQEATIQSIVAALGVFGGAPSKDALDQANTWLQDFQHSADAWDVCNTLLVTPTAPEQARFFAAQTFRAKVTYDLAQLDASLLLPLRDTLIAALETYAAGPRRIIVQLCLALSCFALQTAQWEQPVQDMIERFGKNPATVPVLLQFLKVLPEEIMDSHRIPITNEFYKERSAQLLTANANAVLELLAMYIQAQGITAPLQSQILLVVKSWIASGEILAGSLARTPIFDLAFDALASDPLFDAAVDTVCDIIHETQELDENMQVVERILPRLIALKPLLATSHDDPDRMRGYTRIFTEAGETYRTLLLDHTQTFYPIVEALAECTAYTDLDVVPITFTFWYRLAQSLGKRSTVPPLFIQAYQALVNITIRHLHFPADQSSMTLQELDDFRAFRHHIGDTLKDCCHVLGSEMCLKRAYELLTTAMTGAQTWQEVEAPLFSMRSMGAQMDVKDESVIPLIMDVIPQLPNHPRVRYSATLVIARYTEWLNLHPSYIPGLMTFVSAGFDDADSEVPAASSQAIFYMCKDCPTHLITFVPTLHTFIKTVGPKIVQDDMVQIYEAMAHVLVSMPMDECAQWLKTFSLEILHEVHAVVVKPGLAGRDELRRIADGLERLEAMLHVVRGWGDTLPPACRGTCGEIWTVFDQFLAKYGLHFPLADASSRVLRQGLQLFQDAVLPIVPSVMQRMTSSFETSGFACYLWINAKIMAQFGTEEAAEYRALYLDVFTRSSAKVVQLMQTKSTHELPDVLDDYINYLLQLSDHAPDVLFTLPGLSAGFHAAVEVLTSTRNDDAIGNALFVLRAILVHDSLRASPTAPPKWAGYATAIRSVFAEQHPQLIKNLLTGVVDDFPHETLHTVSVILSAMAAIWPNELAACLASSLEAMPTKAVAPAAKAMFLNQVTVALRAGDQNAVKNALMTLVRESRKTKDRRHAFSQYDSSQY
ncbi:ARM repeat-containing protein [Exidia glandulosa HHB12029]|uniref:ARM repeat-containing protein n=1 Tax=Exidia glandulosa HHB12029 TaxID=1314781 RepID=A0A165PFH1_EXIGL|nr:ARM repeat-containing protein [Exidia glandulosa HHB12029]